MKRFTRGKNKKKTKTKTKTKRPRGPIGTKTKPIPIPPTTTGPSPSPPQTPPLGDNLQQAQTKQLTKVQQIILAQRTQLAINIEADERKAFLQKQLDAAAASGRIQDTTILLAQQQDMEAAEHKASQDAAGYYKSGHPKPIIDPMKPIILPEKHKKRNWAIFIVFLLMAGLVYYMYSQLKNVPVNTDGKGNDAKQGECRAPGEANLNVPSGSLQALGDETKTKPPLPPCEDPDAPTIDAPTKPAPKEFMITAGVFFTIGWLIAIAKLVYRSKWDTNERGERMARNEEGERVKHEDVQDAFHEGGDATYYVTEGGG